MSFINRRKNNKTKKLLIYLVIIAVAAVAAFIFLSPMFEKNSPKISIKNEIYWNLKTPLKVSLSDDNEIKSYEIIYRDEQNEIKLDAKVLKQSKGLIDLDIIPPKLDRLVDLKDVILSVEVYDTSKWNFFRGNTLKKEIQVKVDKKKPIANVIHNSYLIKQGGSATVVVEVKDENLEDFYISFNNKERFELIPFYKENYYMAIIAWPIDIEEFNRVNLIAIDKAKNKTITKVPYYIRSKNVNIDKLKITDNFINKVSKNVLEKSGFDIPENQADVFIAANQDLRESNVNTIKEVSRKNIDFSQVNNFSISPFKRLSGSKSFAGYGERRHYFYKGDKIHEAWHLGMDWASIKNAKIYVSNPGKVIFKEYLGIYGNTAIVDHGFGLSSLYAHASRFNIDVNDEVSAKQQIANTGSSGAVFGDHLHFGILVQGLEVNPIEWMDKKWINTNVTKILNQAKKVIDTK